MLTNKEKKYLIESVLESLNENDDIQNLPKKTLQESPRL